MIEKNNNPGMVGDDGYVDARFADLNIGELFWLNKIRSDNNHAHRKTSEIEAVNIKLQKVVKFHRHKDVFYKM